MDTNAIIRLEGQGLQWLPSLEWEGSTLGDLHARAIGIIKTQAAMFGETPPLWLFCLPRCEEILACTTIWNNPGEKNLWVNTVRHFLRAMNVSMYAFIAEGWADPSHTKDQILVQSVSRAGRVYMTAFVVKRRKTGFQLKVSMDSSDEPVSVGSGSTWNLFGDGSPDKTLQ